jgi:hypothetical protein
VELALWTHYVATELSPELLSDLPGHTNDNHTKLGGTNGVTTAASTQLEPSDNESNLEPAQPTTTTNGVIDSLDESTRSEDSLEKPNTPILVANDETNDSDSQSSAKRWVFTIFNYFPLGDNRNIVKFQKNNRKQDFSKNNRKLNFFQKITGNQDFFKK